MRPPAGPSAISDADRRASKVPSSARGTHWARTAPWYIGGTWFSTSSARIHPCAPTLRFDEGATAEGCHDGAKDPNTMYEPCGRVAGLGTPRPPMFAVGSKPDPRTTTSSPGATREDPTGVVPSARNTWISGSNTGAGSAKVRGV